MPETIVIPDATRDALRWSFFYEGEGESQRLVCVAVYEKAQKQCVIGEVTGAQKAAIEAALDGMLDDVKAGLRA